jgi:hypothetical protein
MFQASGGHLRREAILLRWPPAFIWATPLPKCFALFVLFLAGCGAISVTVEQPVPEQRLEGSFLGSVLGSFFPSAVPLKVDLKAETEKRNTGPATTVTLESVELFITPESAPQGNFDFLTSLTLSIGAEGLPTKQIGTLPMVMKGATRIAITVDKTVELLPYVNAGAQISAQATGTQPSQTTTFAGNIVVRIGV